MKKTNLKNDYLNRIHDLSVEFKKDIQNIPMDQRKVMRRQVSMYMRSLERLDFSLDKREAIDKLTNTGYTK